MEGSPGPSDLRKQLKEREAEVGILRDRLRESQEEIDRLRRENEELRKELKAAGRGKSLGQSKWKKKRKRSGRKIGKVPLPSAAPRRSLRSASQAVIGSCKTNGSNDYDRPCSSSRSGLARHTIVCSLNSQENCLRSTASIRTG